MAEETWHQARLIPTSGINGADEQERRATSALLAVMSSVREFGRVLTQPLGAPAGALETYIEVPFQFGERRLYPDGLIRARRGQKEWTALVEVKTGVNELATEQLEAYLDIAREQDFDAVITISNEIPAIAGLHPTKIDKRKLKRVALHHWSWSQVLAEAVLQKEHRGVADPDQAWILGELIRYLEHPRSGALEFDDMGASWVTTREAVASGTLRPGDKCAPEVAARFDALLRYVSLQLGRRLGDDVTPALSRKELAEPALRSQALVQSMCANGTLQGAINIPNTVGPLVVTTDLRAGRVTCHVDISAPRDGRAATRVNWLVRQLRHAPDSVRLEAFAMHTRGAGTAELLKVVREQPTALIEDPKKDLRSFRVALALPLGTKRGRGRGSFIESVETAINTFYGDVVQDLRTWTAVPPRLRETPEQPEGRPSLASTALSSQDGQEPGDEPAAEPVTALIEPPTAAAVPDQPAVADPGVLVDVDGPAPAYAGNLENPSI
ncbi:MAG TPA: hypothetical protein VFG33_35995 [Kribbella sp.]|uniref:hypothetical protein n=1 Tax=Kribbella sp. TaxID=1871183 RepID=UPI002D799E1C|nr:hypothetical protein [Kribbella sp.]HET6298827.1 hypothetical protein [Kribbella sp.]